MWGAGHEFEFVTCKAQAVSSLNIATNVVHGIIPTTDGGRPERRIEDTGSWLCTVALALSRFSLSFVYIRHGEIPQASFWLSGHPASA